VISVSAHVLGSRECRRAGQPWRRGSRFLVFPFVIPDRSCMLQHIQSEVSANEEQENPAGPPQARSPSPQRLMDGRFFEERRRKLRPTKLRPLFINCIPRAPFTCCGPGILPVVVNSFLPGVRKRAPYCRQSRRSRQGAKGFSQPGRSGFHLPPSGEEGTPRRG